MKIIIPLLALSLSLVVKAETPQKASPVEAKKRWFKELSLIPKCLAGTTSHKDVSCSFQHSGIADLVRVVVRTKVGFSTSVAVSIKHENTVIFSSYLPCKRLEFEFEGFGGDYYEFTVKSSLLKDTEINIFTSQDGKDYVL